MPAMSTPHVTEVVDGALIDEDEVPCDRLCIFWCGTAGLGGHLLGTDEENILYVKYTVLDLPKKQILYDKEFTIKPPLAPHSSAPQGGSSSCGSSAASDDGSSGRDAATPHISEMCRRDYQLTEDLVRDQGLALETVLQEVDQALERISEEAAVNNLNSSTNHNNHHSNHLSPTPFIASDSPSQNSNNNNHTSSTSSSSSRKVTLITDGQLHLRQVLHPKTAFHNIDLPATYNTFFDLRKEFRKCYKSDEVMSIQDMVNSLDMTSDTSENVGRRSVANMVNIIFRLVADGHTFVNPEQILVKLEPGIISKGEEVDNGCVVRARGLPWMSTDTEIARFFRGLNVAKGGVALCLSPQGRRNGEALIRFLTGEHRDMALRRHKHHMGGRYIEVYKATGEDFISVAGGNNNEATQFLSRGNVIIRMRGLPYDCTAKQVVDFFDCGENAVKLLDSEEGVLFVRKPDGRATGDAFVMLAHEDDVTKALTKHRELIGSRYIELFRSTSAEVMNRSMDIRHMDTQQQQQQQPQLPPLIAQLPTLPPLIPQQSVALGTRRDCIRLRGLPFEATIENVLDFLGEYAKHIQFHGVHMVYTPSGQPSGEAFIQMTSEHAAYSCALNRHNRFMAGKKHRYVEVFSCSGDDMNYVLQGGSSPTSQTVTSVGPAAANRSIIPAAGGGMFVWGNAATSGGAPPPPLILPSHAPPSHMQPPSLASIPPPSPTSSYLQPAAAAAAAAAAAGIRPPFSPGLPAGVPHTLLPPPTNGMAMLSHLHSPSMKPSSAQVLLPSPLSQPHRPPSLDVSVSQASHSVLSPLKTSTASAAAAAAAAAAVYPSGMFACYQAPTSSASQSASSGMFLIPPSSAKLPNPPTSVSMTPPVQFFSAFQHSATDPNTSKASSQLHLLPSPYSSGIPAQRRPPSVVVSAAGGVVAPMGGSVTSKRSYEQAFSGDRGGSVSGSSAVGAKRLATASIHSSVTPRPTAIPTFSQSSAHFATQFGAFAPQFATAPGGTFSPGLTAPPMAAPMLHAIYPPPLYHPM